MTTIRRSLRSGSRLLAKVEAGLQALRRPHRGLVDDSLRTEFDDSLDLDAALRREHAGQRRWDYVIGRRRGAQMIGLEPHPASDREVDRVIEKRSSAVEQLAPHLRPGCRVAAWCWVATGRVDFLTLERVRRRLDQEGITFVDGRLLPKHLPAVANSRHRRGR